MDQSAELTVPAATEGTMALAIDIDWAPDFLIDETATMLAAAGVKATWFVTHESAALERLRDRPELFELGIHPNCLPGSTHGSGDAECLEHVKSIVPEAVSMRTHGLYQTTNFLVRAARDFGIRFDLSLVCHRAEGASTHQFKYAGVQLVRVHCYWEDDFEFFQDPPCWTFRGDAIRWEAVRIFAFHPVHVALNSSSPDVYERACAQRPLESWTPQFVAGHRQAGPGVRTCFEELLASSGGRARWVRDLEPKSPT